MNLPSRSAVWMICKIAFFLADSINQTNGSPSLNKSKITPTSTTYSYKLAKDWPLTRILSKKGINLENHADTSVQIATPDDGDFQTFIQDSALWVDKSLLIKKMWKSLWNSEVVIATAPPKWGKTINLSMIKFYCELPLDSDGFETPKQQSASHLYFNEGKVVLKNGTIQELDGVPLVSGFQEHLADHPVIYMSGVNLTMENILESVRIMIHQTYKRHESLLRRLDKEHSKASTKKKDGVARDIEQFRTFYDPEKATALNESQVVEGIQHLSELLNKTYKRKVVILFDDHEYYVYRTYFVNKSSNFSSNCSDNFNTIWKKFLHHTIQSNAHLEKAVISGAIRAPSPGTLMGSRVLTYYKAYVFDNRDLYPYYGIFEKEFLEMARLRGIDNATIENATQWYGGYSSLSHVAVQMYSPYSTSRFISTLQIRDYQPTSWLSDFISRMLQKPKLKEKCFSSTMESFTRGTNNLFGVPISYFSELSLRNFENLQKVIIQNESEYYGGLHNDAIGSIFLSSGYASVIGYNRNQFNVLINVLPNLEMYTHFSDMLNGQ
ncbi:uncharacterized protein LOC135843874 [Planococcus citri]|uniref:uncharacterized protein LOC135843874 n=1 Tax=Planococcus citri TaxID=170843 RepID=UPI0031F8B1DE